jgi:hypothetical protein
MVKTLGALEYTHNAEDRAFGIGHCNVSFPVSDRDVLHIEPKE